MSKPPRRMFLTMPELAQVMALSLATVKRRVADGAIPCVRLKGKRGNVRIPIDALTNLVEDQRALDAIIGQSTKDMGEK